MAPSFLNLYRVYARQYHLGPLGEELDAEERVDEDEDKPDELRRKSRINMGQTLKIWGKIRKGEIEYLERLSDYKLARIDLIQAMLSYLQGHGRDRSNHTCALAWEDTQSGPFFWCKEGMQISSKEARICGMSVLSSSEPRCVVQKKKAWLEKVRVESPHKWVREQFQQNR